LRTDLSDRILGLSRTSNSDPDRTKPSCVLKTALEECDMNHNFENTCSG
uniref:Androgen receptor n=1 Tax=Haemonchus placei TaxID=6290 RepID=A0A0N4W844_HAEPC